MGGLYDTVAGTADHLAGSIDESVGRQFDDEEGGGSVDEFGAFIDPSQSASDQTEQDASFALAGLGPGGIYANLAAQSDNQQNPFMGEDGRTRDTNVTRSVDVDNKSPEEVQQQLFSFLPDFGRIGKTLLLIAALYAAGQLFNIGLGSDPS